MAEPPASTEEIVARYGGPDKPFLFDMISFDDYLDCHLEGMYQNFGQAANPESREYFSYLSNIESEAMLHRCFIVRLAVRYCARDATFQLPPQSMLREVLVACKDATIDELESLDREMQQQAQGSPSSQGTAQYKSPRVSTLQTPLLRQLVVCLALTLRNKCLAKEIAAKYPPTPNSDILFGTAIYSSRHSGPPPELLKVVSHPAFRIGRDDKPTDNGSDVWVVFLRAGWAKPEPEMLVWAGTSPIEEDGRALLRELAEPLRIWADTQPNQLGSKLWVITANTTHPALLSDILTIFNPAQLGHVRIARRVSHMAAVRGPEFLDVLLQHRADDLYGLDRGYQKERKYQDSFVEGEDQFFGQTQETTALHAAATDGNAASVDFLLKRGAPRLKDGWGRTAYEATLHQRNLPPRYQREERVKKLDEVIAVFERYGWQVSEPGEAKGETSSV